MAWEERLPVGDAGVTSSTISEILTVASLAAARVRAAARKDGAEGSEVLFHLDEVISALSRVRELTTGEQELVTSAEPKARNYDGLSECCDIKTETERLRAQVIKLERRYSDLIRQTEHRNRQIEEEFRVRIKALEQGQYDLLHGTIFTALRKIGSLARTLRLLPSRPTTTLAQLPPLASPGPVSGKAGKPRIRIAGIPYMSRPRHGISAHNEIYVSEPLISVVMTAYNTGAYVEAAVRSILNQTWSKLEVIVVDDCSTDDTREVLRALAAQDDRLKTFCFGVNRGTYWSKNYGITRAAGEVVTFMDSDDISTPTRIAEQFKLLNQRGVAVTTCNHIRRNSAGETIAINGEVERVAYISQMVKRAVFREIGYFDTVRTSADDEFLRRIRRTYGREAERNVKKPLYIALLRDGSLTSDPENAINFAGAREGQSFLSSHRRNYAAACESWHAFLEEKNLRPYVPFPVVRRPFPATGKLVVGNGKYDGNFISACLASYPPRRDRLRNVVDRVLPQVDHLYVYLNEYAEDEIPDFLRHSRITVRVGGRNLRDNGKFFFMDTVRDGYVITVDDDLEYPEEYVQTLIRKIEFYERQAVVGLHGTIYGKPFVSFFQGRVLLHFEEGVANDTVVNQLGTGTVAFHTSTIRPKLEWFKQTGMADVWFAVEARKRQVPLIAIERNEEWLASQGFEEKTLFREFRKNDRLQTQAVREMAPWDEKLPPQLGQVVAERSERFGRCFSDFAPREGLSLTEIEEIATRRAERYARSAFE